MSTSPSALENAFVKAKRRDRFAAGVIVIGGVGIIVAVVLMLILILSVAFPLFGSPAIHKIGAITNATAGEDAIATGVDDYYTLAYVLNAAGTVTFFDLDKGEVQLTKELRDNDETKIVSYEKWGLREYSLLWDDGKTSTFGVTMRVSYEDQGVREIVPSITAKHLFDPLGDGIPVQTAVRVDDDGGVTYAELTGDGKIHLSRTTREEDFLGNVTETKSSASIVDETLTGTLQVIRISSDGRDLYAGADTGHVYHWDLKNLEEPELRSSVQAGGDAITALGLVFGDITLAVGTETGAISGWFDVEQGGSGKTLARIHELKPLDSAVAELGATRRNKVVLALSESGALELNTMTTERHLLKVPHESVSVFGISGKGDGIATIDDIGTLHIWELDMPHPEISFGALFSKIWYENYNSAEYVWQSSAPSDDYEPKFSMVPLIFGTFKGAIYALFFAIPLSLLGAIYTSQFARPEHRAMIKPVVEVMATIPSVVIGFLIALWLAPIVDDFLLAFFIVLFMLPLTFVIFILLYSLLDGTWIARRIALGYEFIAVAPVMILACLLSWLISIPMESLLFDGNIQLWLYENLGQRYDQRNAIIISVGLGFAAIPIIFTMSEDALSNLPATLRAGSLALGASRWQTAWRVVLPSASPGIFAAMIIGFGRVIGETMIVLMATGNTPIMDWSPFNGMRTLSANIAVEIPEAPVGGTLYRILFLSAVILFLITFVLNTIAELIRQRLRRKYGQFQ